ncbi:riboflavin biosynthesis protein RibA [Mycolicibacterium moriokaense]|nr:riboflavin biosynthesis protein RibA [Mycolicibacterium moriokaense]
MRTTDVRVRRATTALAAGRPVVLTDDAAAKGYLAFAAEAATATLVAFAVRHTSGYLRVALPATECERLHLPPMCRGDGDRPAAAHRVTVDWHGTGTGISATDRARTIAALAAGESEASDFRRPGHVVPVQVAAGGVLARRGAAEAAVDLARMAGRRPAAALSEIVSRAHPAAMADGAELIEFADRHRLALLSIDDIAEHRRRTEPQVVRTAEAVLPTPLGASRVIGFRDVHAGGEHLVVFIGAADPDVPMPLHIHLECLTGDVFGSTDCRCGDELDTALATMRARDTGMLVYLRPSAAVRACGLFDRDEPAAERMSEITAWILRDLGVHSVRLSDDAPGLGLVMFGAIREHGLNVTAPIPALAAAG